MHRKKWVFGLMGGIALALSLAATPARAQAVRVVIPCFTQNIAATMNDCNGEIVTFSSGSLTACAKAVGDTNGGAHADVHVYGHLEGVGMSSQYLLNVDSLGSVNLPSSGSAEGTVFARAVLVSQGPAPNEVADIFMHVTVNANGVPTALDTDIIAECPGS